MRTPRNETPQGIAGSHVPERTCILTGRKGTKDELVRLALGPDGTVAPDARARAPGRGAWIGVTRADLDAANSKGKLKVALREPSRPMRSRSLPILANALKLRFARPLSTVSGWRRARAI